MDSPTATQRTGRATLVILILAILAALGYAWSTIRGWLTGTWQQPLSFSICLGSSSPCAAPAGNYPHAAPGLANVLTVSAFVVLLLVTLVIGIGLFRRISTNASPFDRHNVRDLRILATLILIVMLEPAIVGFILDEYFSTHWVAAGKVLLSYTIDNPLLYAALVIFFLAQLIVPGIGLQQLSDETL